MGLYKCHSSLTSTCFHFKTSSRRVLADEPHSTSDPSSRHASNPLHMGNHVLSCTVPCHPPTGLYLLVKQTTRSFNLCSAQGPPPSRTDTLPPPPIPTYFFYSPSAGPGRLCAGKNPLALFSLVPNPLGLVWPWTPVWSPLHSVREAQCLELAYLQHKGHLPSGRNDGIQTVSALESDTDITFPPRRKLSPSDAQLSTICQNDKDGG